MEEREALRRALARNPKSARMLRGMIEQGKIRVAGDEMLLSAEPIMVLCVRWPGLVDGSAMALCGFCGAEVALAPSSQEMIRNATVPILYSCMECFNDGAVDRYEAEQKAIEANAAAQAAGRSDAER